ncbi:hypothetical protein Droror1_Dr00013132 [Drosera rotundifolia]
MVKLASAREIRRYGPSLALRRSEYINAGLYLFAAVLLVSAFAAQFSTEPASGLVLLLIALAIIAAVNVHDLIAHLAGIDYRVGLVEYDLQLVLVEFAVPVVVGVGCVVEFLGVLLVLLQEKKGYNYILEWHAMNLLIAGPVLWLIGSILNSCQIYERADGHVQILQESVLLPFLMGSLLLLVGAVMNHREQTGRDYHGIGLLGSAWIWLGICASIALFVGGLANVVKVFNMQQVNGLRLEKLRGGAQERLMQEREGLQTPLMINEQRRRRRDHEQAEPSLPTQITPYKDVLLSQSS